MTQTRNPMCFIAMAFGQDDTDTFYEKLILPVLKRNNVKAVIINRHQSNDDLNIQIFEQLRKADFCIADLTYVRPSVYFEAGFAEREIPVIYTVRRDHLNKGQPDDRRVHFDLQMKPIIIWENSSDSSFAGKLEKRLSTTILRDWNKKNSLQLKAEAEKNDFAKLPLTERLVQLRHKTIYAMRRVGIPTSAWDITYFFNPSKHSPNTRYNKDFIISGKLNNISASRTNHNTMLDVSIQSYATLTKGELRDLSRAYTNGFSAEFRLSADEWKNIYTIFSNTIILCLKRLTANQIESIITEYEPLERAKTYIGSTMSTFSGHTVEIISIFHFLSGIESPSLLKNMLDDLISNYLEKQIKDS